MTGKIIRYSLVTAAYLLLSPAFSEAAYNPGRDNPYVKNQDSGSARKWYQFYKKEKRQAYSQKPSGYWHSTKKENILVRGAKGTFEGVKRIIDAA